jgi:hypothetical protein
MAGINDHKKGPKPKIYSKEDLLRAMKVTKSIRSAARYLNCSYQHVKPYFKSFRVDDNDPNSLTLFDVHKNQVGKGIPKFLKHHGKDPDLQKILRGELYTESFSIDKFKRRLIQEAILAEECSCCEFKEQRVSDYRVPLLINFKNGNKRDWKRENLEFLCYNCYYLTIGDIFTPKQIQGIEDTYEIPKAQEVKWEMDDAMYEHFKSLNLLDENDVRDEDDDIVSYTK